MTISKNSLCSKKKHNAIKKHRLVLQSNCRQTIYFKMKYIQDESLTILGQYTKIRTSPTAYGWPLGQPEINQKRPMGLHSRLGSIIVYGSIYDI